MTDSSSNYGQPRHGGYDNRRHDDRRGGGGGFWGGRDGGSRGGGVDSRWANLDNDREEYGGGRHHYGGGRSGGYGGGGYGGDRGYGRGGPNRGDDRLAGKWDSRGQYHDPNNVDWTKVRLTGLFIPSLPVLASSTRRTTREGALQRRQLGHQLRKVR